MDNNYYSFYRSPGHAVEIEWIGGVTISVLKHVSPDHLVGCTCVCSIGQFWACKSPNTGFGVQYRLFRYSHVSFIGAIAIKTGLGIVCTQYWRCLRCTGAFTAG